MKPVCARCLEEIPPTVMPGYFSILILTSVNTAALTRHKLKNGIALRD